MGEWIGTACPRDCPDGCSVRARVENGRIVRIAGDPSHPVTRGFLCERTSKFLARHHSPDRLRTPMVRRQGVLVPASWDEAMALCADRLGAIARESGPHAIVHYRGGGSLGLLKGLADRLFAHFGPVTIVRGSVCDGAGIAAQTLDFGDVDSSDIFDLLSAKTIVLWGKNPTVSSPHLLPILRQARANGARLVLVDPVRHRTAASCDWVVQPRPGGDLALALGVGRMLFERGAVHPEARSWCEGLDRYRRLVESRSLDEWADHAGVRPAELARLAAVYVEPGPSTILVGWGMQRRTHGGAIVRAIDALGLVTGNIGVPGGGVSFYFKRRGGFDLSALAPPVGAERTIREPLFGQDVLAAREPPIRAAWISCANPAVMLPDSKVVEQALATRELVVVVDSFMTDTARLATVVLPCATFLEDDDLVGAYGHHYLGEVRPVVPPPESVRTDYAILRDLAERLGLGSVLAGTIREWKERLLTPTTLARLAVGPVRSTHAPIVAFEGRRFPTPTAKGRLLDSVAEGAVERSRSDADFPLQLAALSVAGAQCSQWSPTEPAEPLPARVHPRAAGTIASGEHAWLVSALGRARVVVWHDESVRQGWVVVPKGGSGSLGRGANALISARLTDLGEGAALYEQPVRLQCLDALRDTDESR